MDFRDLGRELKRLGTPEDRVKVLDVDHSATTFRLPQIESRVRVGVYYLRPPEGVSAQEVKELIDKWEDAAFRYRVSSGIGTDHMELLTPDEYARQYFSTSTKLIHVEGARKSAREQLEEMFDEMKAEFDATSFPHLEDVTIPGHKPGSDELSTEVKLLVSDDDFRTMSKIERDIAIKLSEANLHREILVGRHLVKDTNPEIILNSTAKATFKGKEFLNSLATYLLERDGGIQTEPKRRVTKPIKTEEPSAYKTLTRAFPRTPTINRQPLEIVDHAVSQFHETLSGMSAFKDLEIKKMPQRVHVHFPKKMFGRKFEDTDLRELKAVHTSILGSPGLHDGWKAYHLYDKQERILKIRFTTPDENLESPWTKLGKA